jgi:hypothetical protein
MSVVEAVWDPNAAKSESGEDTPAGEQDEMEVVEKTDA